MTISSTVNRADYVGTGTTGPFAYPFKVFAATDLSVTTRDATTGIETTLSYPADFSATGVGNAAGGSITLTTALATGDTLTIRRVLPLTQLTSLRNAGTFFPATHEDVFDRLVMIDQQQQDDIDRSLKVSDTVGIEPTLPAPEAGKALVWNDTEDGLVNRQLAADATSSIPGKQLAYTDAASENDLDVRFRLPQDGRTVASPADYWDHNKRFNARDYGGGPSATAAVNTTAIQAAIDQAAAVGGVALVDRGGVWQIDGTLVVPAGATLRMDRATTLKPTTDADVVEVAMNGRVEGAGTIDFSSLATFTHAGIVVNGTASWNTNAGHAPLADDLRIIGNRQTDSAGVRYTCTDGDFVSYTRMTRLSIQNCYYGIHLDPVSGTGVSYVNGNEFEAHITGCVYPVYTGDTTSTTAADGNGFDVQIQTVAAMERAAYLGGLNNRLTGMLWDFSGGTSAGYPVAVELGPTSATNRVMLRGLAAGNILDHGTLNSVAVLNTVPWLRAGIVPPHGFDTASPQGNADDALFAATNKYLVTASVDPTSGAPALSRLFSPDPTSFCAWDSAGTGSPQTITVDLNGASISGPIALGVQFVNGQWATHVTLELYDGASWHTLFDNASNQSAQVIAPVPANLVIASFTKARLTIEGYRSGKTTIRVARFFAYAISVAATGFLPTTGGTVYGDTTLAAALHHTGTTAGFFGVAARTRPGALTQTYATADRTLSAYTANVQSAAYTGGTDATTQTNLNTLRVAYENLRAFTEDLAQLVNALVDDLQSLGLAQ